MNFVRNFWFSNYFLFLSAQEMSYTRLWWIRSCDWSIYISS